MTCRFDTLGHRVPKADFGTGFKIVVDATGEYAAVSLPPAHLTLREVEEEPVVRGSRESIGDLGVESYAHEQESVKQDVVSVSSGHDAYVGAEANPEGAADIVVAAEPDHFAASDSRPARKMWKRLSGWCARHREDADDFLNGPWY